MQSQTAHSTLTALTRHFPEFNLVTLQKIVEKSQGNRNKAFFIAQSHRDSILLRRNCGGDVSGSPSAFAVNKSNEQDIFQLDAPLKLDVQKLPNDKEMAMYLYDETFAPTRTSVSSVPSVKIQSQRQRLERLRSRMVTLIHEQQANHQHLVLLDEVVSKRASGLKFPDQDDFTKMERFRQFGEKSLMSMDLVAARQLSEHHSLLHGSATGSTNSASPPRSGDIPQPCPGDFLPTNIHAAGALPSPYACAPSSSSSTPAYRSPHPDSTLGVNTDYRTIRNNSNSVEQSFLKSGQSSSVSSGVKYPDASCVLTQPPASVMSQRSVPLNTISLTDFNFGTRAHNRQGSDGSLQIKDRPQLFNFANSSNAGHPGSTPNVYDDSLPFCPRCNKQFSIEASFCSQCGALLKK